MGARSFALRVLDALRIRPPIRQFTSWLKWRLDSGERAADAAYRAKGAPDALPLPPAGLIYFVVGGHSKSEFYFTSGLEGARCIREALAKQGRPIESFARVLEFGCGCGRVLRHWARVPGPQFHGCDYNADLVQWCREALPFATTDVNGAAPPLPYADGMFDLVYAVSVFTHIPEHLQAAWAAELRRIVRPGGVVLLTLHGRARLDARTDISDETKKAFEAGKLVVLLPQYGGTNACAVYHPIEWVRSTLAQGFRLLDHLPSGAKDVNQDIAILAREADGAPVATAV